MGGGGGKGRGGSGSILKADQQDLFILFKGRTWGVKDDFEMFVRSSYKDRAVLC